MIDCGLNSAKEMSDDTSRLFLLFCSGVIIVSLFACELFIAANSKFRSFKLELKDSGVLFDSSLVILY